MRGIATGGRARSVLAVLVVTVLSAAAMLAGASAGQAATTPATPTSAVPAPTAPAPAPTTTPAPAPTGRTTCDQFGSFPVAGAKYVVQNDRWGASTEQCISAFDTGFTLTSAKHVNNTGPAGYPSIYRGCNYGYCTASSPFPRLVSDVGALRSSWTTTGPTGGGVQQYNTAYDIWFDPTTTNSGRPKGAEMMVWLNRTAWVQPIGRKYTEVNIAGTVYEVWYGTIDLPVISFVRKVPTTSVTNLPLDSFVKAAQSYGVVKPNWYLTSVQAGFEPWTGGTGLTTKSFSVTRNGL